MAYTSNGSLTTDKRVVDDTTTWDAQSDWEAYQSKDSVVVTNGAVQLAEVQAQIIDSFEDGGISEYTGRTGSFSTDQTRAVDGSTALYSTVNYGNIYSTVGLDRYPSSGDTIWWYTYMGSGGDRASQFFFGVQDQSNYYESAYSGVNGRVFLRKVSGGSGSIMQEVSVQIPRDGWVRNELEWDVNGNGNISYAAYLVSTEQEIGSVTATDTEYSNGGIGWGVYGGTDVPVWSDYAQMRV